MTLSARINDALARYPEADPTVIASKLRDFLTAPEREELLDWALRERVRLQIDRCRSTAHEDDAAEREREKWQEISRRGGRMAAAGRARAKHLHETASTDELREQAGRLGSLNELAQHLGIGNQAVRRLLEARGIDFEAERERYRRELWADVWRARDEMVAHYRAEGISIGLAQAERERVSVAGRWMMLADCSAADLHTLAEKYQSRAIGQLDRGVYYLAIASELEERGLPTVRAMCEAQAVAVAA